MAIVEMKKIFLLAHREEREKVLDLLYRMGTVELVDVKSGDAWSELKAWLEPDQAPEEAAAVERRLAEVRYCLDFLQRYFPVRKGFLEQFTGGKREISADEFAGYRQRVDEAAAVYTACREAEEKLSKIRNEEARCKNMLEELKPWVALSLPLGEIGRGAWVEMGLAAVPVEAYARFRSALAEEVPDFCLVEVSADKEQVYMFYIYPAADAEQIQTLFKEASVVPVSFPGLEGTAAEAARALEDRLAELEAQREAVLNEIKALLEHRPLLMALYDYLDNERAKQEAAVSLARTENSFLLEGWAPAPAVENLAQTLRGETSTALLVHRDPEKYEETPVLLQNNWPVEPFEVVTRLYSVPRRDELDPTPFMAPFFFIFFGICLADVGYGIVLSALAFLLMHKLKPGGMGKQLVNLLFLGGVSSALFGVVLGGYLGDLFNLPPLWFNPLEDPITMLIFCFAAGLFHIFFGMGIQAYRSIRAGKPLDALMDQGIWFVFLTGLLLLAVPGFKDAAMGVAAAGAAGLLVTQGRRHKGLLMKFFSGLGSLYNVTGYLSDVLSYSRLLALGLSTAVIATVINVMGKLMAGSLVGLLLMFLILAGGHLFNLFIGVLGAYVHTSRLQYIEFFGKFFEGGGRAFRPFRGKTKFFDVVEKEAGSPKMDTATATPSGLNICGITKGGV